MSEPEVGLDTLMSQMSDLPRADRVAILSRLTARDRKRLARNSAQRDAARLSPFCPDIARRIADVQGTAMTPAGRHALMVAVGVVDPRPEPVAQKSSLLDSVVDRFRRLVGER